jgi:hypothetical protein
MFSPAARRTAGSREYASRVPTVDAGGDDPLGFNLEALDGPVTVELGPDTAQADVRVVRAGRDDDWGQLYDVWRAYWPGAADYEKKTSRKFPLAVITVR